VAFVERLVHAHYGHMAVPMEVWGSLKLSLGFLQVTDGRINPRMMLRGRTGRGWAGSRRRRASPRRSRLRVKNYWQ
jgi:hypothetical protein